MLSSRSARLRRISSRLHFIVIGSLEDLENVVRPRLDVGQRVEYSQDVVAAQRKFRSGVLSSPWHQGIVASGWHVGKMALEDGSHAMWGSGWRGALCCFVEVAQEEG